MSTLLLTHPCFLLHDTGPGHPERPDRMRAIDRALSHPLFQSLERIEAPLRNDVEAAINLAHPTDYIEAIRAARPDPGDEPVYLDPDTVLSSGTWEAAMRAVGAGLEAVDAVMTGKNKNAFCQVRPCGHHAEARARWASACSTTWRSPALCAQEIRRRAHRRRRFRRAPRQRHAGHLLVRQDLFFASTHQMPLYPGTGALGETRRRQHLQRAAAAGRRRRAVSRGVRRPHAAGTPGCSRPT